jgi:hypothetical protein
LSSYTRDVNLSVFYSAFINKYIYIYAVVGNGLMLQVVVKKLKFNFLSLLLPL